MSDAAFGAPERMIAGRYLRTREREGFISVIAAFAFAGVALGVATLIVVLSVMSGFRQQLVGRILGVNGHIAISAPSGPLPDYEALAAKAKAVPGVLSAAPIFERQAMASRDGASRPVTLRGVRPQDVGADTLIGRNIVAGGLGQFADVRGALIGDRLRQNLGLRAGESLSLITYRRNENGTVAARTIDYPILGSFVTKRYEYDGALVLVPIDFLLDDLEVVDDVATRIDVTVADPRATAPVLEALRKTLGRDDLRLLDWRSTNRQFVSALEVERLMMFILLSLIVLIAAMNIVASFTMLVRTKSRSIAILRTMGATQGAIVRIFFLSSAGVGLLGTALGAVLGVLVCVNIEAIGRFIGLLTGGRSAEVEFVTSLPAQMNANEIGAVLAMATLASLAAAVWPAIRAARLDPVEALRYE